MLIISHLPQIKLFIFFRIELESISDKDLEEMSQFEVTFINSCFTFVSTREFFRPSTL